MRTAILLLSIVLINGTTASAQSNPDRPVLIISDTQFGSEGGFPMTRTTTTYTYNEGGQVLREAIESDTFLDGHIDSRTVTTSTYDARGNRLTQRIERDFNADGILNDIETTTWTYNPSDQPLTRTIEQVNPFSTLVVTTTTTFEYGPIGKLVRETTNVSRDFDPEIDSITEVDYSYDSGGKLVLRGDAVFAESVPNPMFNAETYSYDASGNLVQSERTSDIDADPDLDSFSATYSTFDGAGNLLDKITFWDSNADFVIDLLNYAMRLYNSQGKVTLEDRLVDQGANGSIEFKTRESSFYDAAGRLSGKQILNDMSGDGVFDQTTNVWYFY